MGGRRRSFTLISCGWEEEVIHLEEEVILLEEEVIHLEEEEILMTAQVQKTLDLTFGTFDLELDLNLDWGLSILKQY